jgi:hypothetical protein
MGAEKKTKKKNSEHFLILSLSLLHFCHLCSIARCIRQREKRCSLFQLAVAGTFVQQFLQAMGLCFILIIYFFLFVILFIYFF